MSDYITSTLAEGSEAVGRAARPALPQAVRARGDKRKRRLAAGVAAGVLTVAAAGAVTYPLTAGAGAGPGPAPAAAGIAVPDVTGDTLPQAARAVTAAGLSVGRVAYRRSASIDLNQVIGTAPQAGASVARGTSILILVSAGDGWVVVPVVVGESQAAAIAQLTQLGLRVQVAAAAPGGAARGTVTRQAPAGITVQLTGSVVVVYVAR